MVFGRKPKAPNTVETRPTLRALAISDARPEWGSRTLPEVVAQKAVDVVITVGDLHRSDIAGADQLSILSIPVIGVYGNHCDGRYLEDLGATNLHLSQAVVGGLTFVGVQGCVRYKNGSKDLLYTQSEYAEMIRDLPPADVLVTHCPPAGINDHRGDPAHVGIDALRRWIDSTAPRLLIHGHTYPKLALTRHGATRIEYVYGARLLTI